MLIQANRQAHHANMGDKSVPNAKFSIQLTHWGRVTHICVGKLTIIGSDDGLPPGRRQAIIWTNAGILSIVLLGINLSEILIRVHKFQFNKMHLKMSSGKWRPFCLGLNVLSVASVLAWRHNGWYFNYQVCCCEYSQLGHDSRMCQDYVYVKIAKYYVKNH